MLGETGQIWGFPNLRSFEVELLFDATVPRPGTLSSRKRLNVEGKLRPHLHVSQKTESARVLRRNSFLPSGDVAGALAIAACIRVGNALSVKFDVQLAIGHQI